MNRSDFILEMQNTFAEVEQLFKNKNTSYGEQDNVHYNFEQSAKRLGLTPAQVLMCLVDKHMIALSKELLEGKESKERMKDIIAYMVIMLTMKE